MQTTDSRFLSQSRRVSRSGTGRRGFTLMEVLVAVSLMSLLMAGAANLYIGTLRAAGQSTALVGASRQAGIAMQQVMNATRESYTLALPTDATGFVPPQTGTVAANYVAADGSAAALQLTAPGMAAVTVSNSLGVSKTSGQDFAMTYGRSAGASLTVYRSDSVGRPAPNTGQYLWECGTPPGLSALPASGRRLAMLADTPAVAASTTDAIQFVRVSGSTSAIQIRIIASNYSLVDGQQYSQSGASSLVGKWVFARNHL